MAADATGCSLPENTSISQAHRGVGVAFAGAGNCGWPAACRPKIRAVSRVFVVVHGRVLLLAAASVPC